MPTPTEFRTACYAILKVARLEDDPAIKRILASHAFSLAQQAQIESWVEGRHRDVPHLAQ